LIFNTAKDDKVMSKCPVLLSFDNKNQYYIIFHLIIARSLTFLTLLLFYSISELYC